MASHERLRVRRKKEVVLKDVAGRVKGYELKFKGGS